jgi:hypothetical protein
MLQVYPSGAAYHTSCVAQRMLQLTNQPDVKTRLLSLLSKLSGKGAKQRGLDHKLDPATTLKLQQQLASLLREGDPLNSEHVLSLLNLPYGDDGASQRQLWSLTAASRA